MGLSVLSADYFQVSVPEDFLKAANEIRTLDDLPQTDLLDLYGFFKHGGGWDISNTPKPALMDFAGKAKYRSWSEVVESGKTREQAQEEYIALVKKLLEQHKK